MDFSYSSWTEHPWKNELKLQSERVVLHFGEVLDAEFSGSHNPHHMMDRALVLSAFCIRRMIERRLVTDTLISYQVKVRTFPQRVGEDFRAPLLSQSGGDFHRNYALDAPAVLDLTLKGIADEIIHSTQLAVLHPTELASSAIVLASDWGQRRRLLMFSMEEFSKVVWLVLDDHVAMRSDGWDPATGAVTTVRLGRGGSDTA